MTKALTNEEKNTRKLQKERETLLNSSREWFDLAAQKELQIESMRKMLNEMQNQYHTYLHAATDALRKANRIGSL